MKDDEPLHCAASSGDVLVYPSLNLSDPWVGGGFLVYVSNFFLYYVKMLPKTEAPHQTTDY